MKEECLEKNKRQFRVKSVKLVFIRDAHRYWEENLIWHFAITQIVVIVSLALLKIFWSSKIKEFPTNDQNQSKNFLVMRCAIWHHLHNLKKVKKNHGGVLLLVILQAKLATLLKVTLLHGCFSRFLNYTTGTKLCNASQLLLLIVTTVIFTTVATL